MNLNNLANLGQIVGAIGVMMTLVYLAIQIPADTEPSRIAVRNDPRFEKLINGGHAAKLKP